MELEATALTADPQPTPKATARTWQEQVANIQRNLAAKTMSCDRDTHRNDNPQWIEEEKPWTKNWN
jgi:hypothetical protein